MCSCAGSWAVKLNVLEDARVVVESAISLLMTAAVRHPDVTNAIETNSSERVVRPVAKMRGPVEAQWVVRSDIR